MPPITKYERFERSAWSWTQYSNPTVLEDEHVKLAYRILFPRCKIGGCKRNCKGNPHCLSGLGEHKYLCDVNYNNNGANDPEKEKRAPNKFAGLKNLGATCYVNTFLQLWFHNLNFKKAIFLWNPLEDPIEKANETLDTDDYQPLSTIAYLQVVFALLQYGIMNVVDPTDFIQCLRLDTSMQQDAQEFSKLFLSMIESALQYQSRNEVRDLIKDNFCGEYSYVTRCLKCGTESACPSTFYELDLNVRGNKTILDSLREFMTEELLEGENSYYCAICREKQSAHRFISMTLLPPVLNLQLMRFVFDKNLGFKKKLNTFVQFPDTLNMTEFLPDKQNQVEYKLSAVLVHSGRSANSGHYVAHICDSSTGIWYKFNDEYVEEIEGKKLTLGSEEEVEMEGGSKKQPKPPRVAKGWNQSVNAYMLVYTLSKPGNDLIEFCNYKQQPSESWTLHPYLEKMIDKKNREFEEWIQKTEEESHNAKETSLNAVVEMASMITMLPKEEAPEFEAIPASWLTQWVANGGSMNKEINNNKITCPHGKLDPKQLPYVKYISTSAADKLFEKYGGGPRLRSKSFECSKCVLNICFQMRIRNKVLEEQKEISSRMKLKCDENCINYWVGRQSYKSWRKLVMDKVEDIVDSGEMLSKYKCFRDDIDICNRSDRRRYYKVESMKITNSVEVVSKAIQVSNDTIIQKSDETPIQGIERNSVLSNLEIELCKNLPNKIQLSAECISTLYQCYLQTTLPDCDISSIRCLLKYILSQCCPNLLHCAENIVEPKIGTQWTKMNGDVEKSPESDSNSNEDSKMEDSDEASEIKPKLEERSVSTHHNSNATAFNCDENVEKIENLLENNKEQPVDGTSPKQEDTAEMDCGAENKEECGRRSRTDSTSREAKNSENEDDKSEPELRFNEDLLCIHDQLCIEDNLKKLVPPDVWAIFKKYFPDAPELTDADEPCGLCKSIASEDEVAKGIYKAEAHNQKEQLQDLYLDRARPQLTPKNGEADHWSRMYVVNREFINSWRKFVRDAGRRDPPYSIKNKETLLCPEHSKLMFDLNTDLTDLQESLSLVTEEEWKVLAKAYNADVAITATCESDGTITTDPELCEPCMQARLKEVEEAQLNYTRAKIYIKPLLNTEESDQQDETYVSSKKARISPTSAYLPNGETTSQIVNSQVVTGLTIQNEGGQQVRRSSRCRRKAGTRELIVSSDLTLMDVKKKIFSLMNVIPMDQHLSTTDGRNLNENEATLTMLGILPNTTLYLKVDEPSSTDMDYPQSVEPEAGFKGTGLLGC